MMIPSQASKAHSTNQWVEVPVPVVHGEYRSTAFGVTERRDDDEATLSNVTPRPYTRASALRIHHWQLPPRRLVTNPHRASYGLPPWSSCPVHPFVMIAMAVPIRFPPIATGQSRSTNMPVAPKKKKLTTTIGWTSHTLGIRWLMRVRPLPTRSFRHWPQGQVQTPFRF